MAEVTIQAQQSFGGMRAGEIVTVERTAYIERQLANGRVAVVDDAPDVGEVQSAGADDRPERPVTDYAPADPAAGGPPARNASTNEWVEYMHARFPDLEDADELSREQLIAEYDARVPDAGADQ